jgi:hypothetical protein
MTVRAKFTVQSIKRDSWDQGRSGEVTLSAVYDQTTEENRRYAKATPSGSITMRVDNPPALEVFELGKTFYVDFTPAEG